MRIISNSQVVYVDSTATGGNNGSSWLNAYNDLQQALANTSTGEIWVAKGTYYPTSGTNRLISFLLKNNVAIYGGFNGTETNINQRNFNLYSTVLSGNIGNLNDSLDNSYHVVYSNNVNNTAILDGFTLTGGRADVGSHFYGGGINNQFSSPIIRNCVIKNNYAYRQGGGVHCYYGAPIFYNCIIKDNYAAANGGGGVSNYTSNPQFINCSILNNFNRGIYSANGGNLYIDSCIVYNNSGNGIELISSALNITNSTLDSNSTNGIKSSGNSIVLINNCIFSQNGHSNPWGEGYSDTDAPGSTKVYNSTFKNNLQGGMTVYGFATIDSCLFLNNFGTGVVIRNNQNTVIKNSRIDSNTEVGIDIIEGTIKNCIIINNSKPGITASGSTRIEGNTIGSNGALSGSAEGGGIQTAGFNGIIINCLIENNTANAGAGIHHKSGNATIINCILNNNQGTFGAGIYTSFQSPNTDSITIDRCSFINNIGEGLRSETYGKVLVVNSIFRSDTSSGAGTSIRAIYGKVDVINTTFYNNRYVNICTNCGFEIRATQSAHISINNSILWAAYNSEFNLTYDVNTSYISCNYSNVKGGYVGTGNLNVNPMFVDTTNYDLRLHCNSPLINVGTNDSIPNNVFTDFTGNNRIYDSIVDMGAYENGSTNFLANICQGDSILLYGNYQNTSGVYYDSLQTYYGCDSILATTLTVSPIFLLNRNDTICQGDSIQIGGLFQTSAGTYYDSLQTINGCDSVLSITLSVNPVYLSNTNDTICQGDSVLIYGNYENTSGVYYDSLQTINGCDSVMSTTLTVNPLPNVTLANFNPDTICSNTNAVTLPNGSPSGGVYSGTGVNGGTFDPNTAGLGTHSVIYTYTDVNSCINSDSAFITVEQCVGMDDLANDLGILIYPNPNTGLFTIEKPIELDKEVNISLLDASSRVIINKIIPKGQQKIEMDITSYSKGVYYLQLTVGKEVFVKQILKN